MRPPSRPAFIAGLAAILALLAWAAPAGAQPRLGDGQVFSSRVELLVGHSRVISLPAAVKRVSVGKEAIADVVVINPRQLYINGQEVGTTNLSLWGQDDQLMGIYQVRVARDLTRLKERLYELLPHEPIEVREMEGTVVLSGRVSSQQAKDQAEALANALLPRKDLAETLSDKGGGDQQSAANGMLALAGGKGGQEGAQPSKHNNKWVTSLLEVGGNQQVRIKVRFAEVKRDITKHMKINVGAINPLTSDFIFSTLGNYLLPVWDTTNTGKFIGNGYSSNANITGGFNVGGGNIRTALDVLSENQLAKILAEPTLTCVSGQEADFLAGGEFPVPVPQQNNTVTIDFKKFGVQLDFKPEVLKTGRIRMSVAPEVSEMDFSTAVVIQGFTVPGLKTRKAKTQLEVGDGESFVIAGLFREDITHDVAKVPLLGDLPILGALFRSTEFQHNKTELVIEVTPEVVRGAMAGPGPLPTDNLRSPDNDADLFLLGKMTERAEGGPALAPSWNDLEGRFGHEPVY